jgi:phosphotransferase system IIB component
MAMTNAWFLAAESPFSLWYFWVLAVLGSGAVGVLFFFLIRPKKPILRPVNDAFIDSTILRLGGMDNLLRADQDGARLKFTVKNLDHCDLNALRDNGAMGIFVSGNVVKFMLTTDADKLISRIQEHLAGEKK